jgi:hypothetical protein
VLRRCDSDNIVDAGYAVDMAIIGSENLLKSVLSVMMIQAMVA